MGGQLHSVVVFGDRAFTVSDKDPHAESFRIAQEGQRDRIILE
jgi:hypothetical protein